MVGSAPSQLDSWTFVPDTTAIPEDDYVDLEVIDLADFHAFEPHADSPDTPELKRKQDDIIARAFNGLRTIGFIAIKGHGLSEAEWQHQFDLGKLLNDVSEEEKHALHANLKEGNWAGYKPVGYYNRPDGTFDCQEHYDFYPFTTRKSRLPLAAQPYVQDFRSFMEYNHYVIVRKLLAIMSLGLGLDVDAFWKLHQRGGGENDGSLQVGPDDEIEWKHSKDHLRYTIYHPIRAEDRERRNYLLLPGHTDQGSVTLLYSQPIAGLQVLTSEGQWKYIRHYPNHIIVSLGDCMEFLTGGVLKAAPHRVREPPEDQRVHKRLGIFYFVPFLPDVLLAPLDYPSLRALGAKDYFEEYRRLGGGSMTCSEWLIEKSKLVGTKRVRRAERGPRELLEDIHFRYNPS